METIKLPKDFSDMEVIPDNGHSPYTGYTVCRGNFIANDREREVVVKFGEIPKNNHSSLIQEFRLLGLFNHQQIIKTICIQNDYYLVMENLPYGGRRSRWREIIKQWNYGQLQLFIFQMFNIIFWLDSQGWCHNDVEFANIGTRDQNWMPVFFDFGKAKKTNANLNLVKTSLSLLLKSGYNAWARELFGYGGKYAEEGPMYNENYIKESELRNTYQREMEKFTNAHP